jgi:hypothetical protein
VKVTKHKNILIFQYRAKNVKGERETESERESYRERERERERERGREEVGGAVKR